MTEFSEDRFYASVQKFTFHGEQYVQLCDYQSMRDAHRLARQDARTAIASLEKTIAKLYELTMQRQEQTR
jgi:hypothetical protein